MSYSEQGPPNHLVNIAYKAYCQGLGHRATLSAPSHTAPPGTPYFPYIAVGLQSLVGARSRAWFSRTVPYVQSGGDPPGGSDSELSPSSSSGRERKIGSNNIKGCGITFGRVVPSSSCHRIHTNNKGSPPITSDNSVASERSGLASREGSPNQKLWTGLRVPSISPNWQLANLRHRSSTLAYSSGLASGC